MNEELDNRILRQLTDTGVLMGGLANIKAEILKKLFVDERLLRLLHYQPKDSTHLSPLDPKLPNIVGSKKHFEVINKSILKTDKSSNIEDTAICRITVSLGKQRPQWNNNMVFLQDLYINIYTHEKFDDLRIEQISDTLDRALIGARFNGISKIEASGKEPFQGMRQYSQVRCRYKIMGIYGAR